LTFEFWGLNFDLCTMSFKSFLAKPFAKTISRKIKSESIHAVELQTQIMNELIEKGKTTVFGKDHGFEKISNYEDFKNHVPIVDYEQMKNYVERVMAGEENVLWKGKPIYFGKTSGTTSGTKYIPITKDSISNHLDTARNALMCYIAETGKTNWVDGKMIFLSGSPELDEKNGIKTGRLSGIVNHHVPAYLRKNQLPSYQTNCIEDWETKVEKIVEETMNQNMTLISGIPPWVQMYYDRLIERTGKKTIAEIFPNLQLFVYGGVNFAPYREKLERTVGKKIDGIETYPASEGFIAFQDSQKETGLLLNTNSGIFFEFIPATEIFSEHPKRMTLKDVELGINYAIIINNNAGLWGYNIGDTVKFVSQNPYRIVVTGRIKHFISAFGEHVIAEEVEYAILEAAKKMNAEITEFHVAPFISSDQGQSYHEWFIEFAKSPADMKVFANELEQNMMLKNIYYRDLIEGKILRSLKITPMKKDSFTNYMRSKGKLGGQNKVARLGNDRSVADELSTLTNDN